jgi:predicted Fe-Mo cluster-binding NifX family protein
MKIAVSATGPSLDSKVDPRFGRCQYFVIVDPDTMEFETLENPNIMAGGGAGISTAQMVSNMGVQIVLTGNCGPNAYQTLSAAGVQVITGVSGAVRDAMESYKAGRLQATSQPTVGPHSGMGTGGGVGMGGGMGCGRGMGRGIGMMMPPAGPYPQAQSPEQEMEMLKGQTEMLRQQLEAIQSRIEELGGKK